METGDSRISGLRKKRRRRLLILLFCAVVFVGCVLVWWLWPHPEPLYKVIVLPTLGGGYTMPYAINDRGQVAGVSKLADGSDHLFLWDRDKGMRDLGPVVSDLVHINNAGQIAGTMRDPNDCNRAFLWDPNGGRRMLPTLGGDHAEPWALNNVGQIVGVSDTASGASHAFVWGAVNGIRDLTPASAKPTRPFSINDAGRILVFTGGSSLLVSTRQDSAALSSQPAPFHPAHHINNSGHIVGLSRRVKGKIDVQLWRPDSGVEKIARLKGSFPGAPQINDAGQVHFWQARRPRLTLFGRKLLFTSPSHYLWDPGRGRVALDRHVPLASGEDLSITNLNNHGCLVGAVQSEKDSRTGGVLLEPIPERWSK